MTTSSRDTQPLGREKWTKRLATRRGMIFLAAASLVLLLLALVGAWFLFRIMPGLTQPQPKTSPPVSLGSLATEYPELGSVLQDPELDSVYKEFLIAFQEGGPEAAYDLAKKRGLLNDRDELRLMLVLDTTETSLLEQQLASQGITVTAVSDNLMDISIPLDTLMGIMAQDPGSFLESITELEHVIRIRTPYSSVRDASLPLKIESLPVIGVGEWHNAGFTGKGIKIAILDGGFDGYRDLLGSELPASVITRSFVSGWEVDQMGTTHGTACAEIIHDVAPDAELFLVTSDTIVETEQANNWLISQGVDVISHSAGWLYGPKDGKSKPAAVVDKAVSNGIFWVNSSGNYAESHYRGAFTDTDADGYHEFNSTGDEMMAFEPDGMVQLTLNWDDWYGGDQDYDLFILDYNGNEIASSRNIQTSPQDSVEVIQYSFSDDGPYYAAFYAMRSTRPALFDFFLPETEIEYYSVSSSLNTPSDSISAFTIGATNWEDDSLEYYSSQGPTDDNRLKPDLSAPSAVSSVAMGRTFYGTSASTPHVAGAAGLILQASPDMSPQLVADFLKERAVDLGPGGPDYAFGYGRLNMGDPPGSGSLLEPTTTELALLPTFPSTETEQAQETLEPTKTSAPKRRPTATLSPEEEESASSGLVLGFLACVVLPGFLGLAGIGLVGGVWYMGRSRAQSRKPAKRARRKSTPWGAILSFLRIILILGGTPN